MVLIMLVGLELSMNYPALDSDPYLYRKKKDNCVMRSDTGKIGVWHLGELSSENLDYQ